MKRALIAMFGFLLGTTISGFALGQVPARSVRLDLTTDIVQFRYGGWNPAGPEDWRHSSLDAGVGTPNVQLGLGVTVVDALAIGLHFGVAMEKGEMGFDEDDSGIEEDDVTTDFDAMKYNSFRWSVMPYLEYAFLENVVRPFIMFTLGFEGETNEANFSKTNFWDFVFGLGGGLHFFVSPAVSVDLGVLLGFSAGGGSTESLLEPPDGADPPEKERFTRVLFRLNGCLGLSGWF